MEHTKMEMLAIEEATKDAARAEIQELNELQLALVGGGIADVLVG
jgi:hypothetical protein